MDKLIAGVSLTPLKIIRGEHGDVKHALKSSESSFDTFGEAYFSSVKQGEVKGWKFHKKMTLNLIVPVGGIRFVIYDGRNGSQTENTFNDIVLGSDHDYSRLTVIPGLWMAFQGVGENLNLLLNIASIEHDPTETENLPLENDIIPRFNWK